MPPPTIHTGTYNDLVTLLADRLVRGRAPDGSWDVSRALQTPVQLVIPSRGAAAAISSALLKRIPSGITGVDMHSPEDLALRLLNGTGKFPHVAEEDERREAVRAAAVRWDDEMATIPGIDSMIERTYRDVRDSGRTLSAFEKSIAGAPSLRGREVLLRLLAVWRTYEELLAQMGSIDPADLLLAARGGAGRSIVPPQIVFGFYDMTGSQWALIESLGSAKRIDSIFIPIDPARTAYRFGQPFLRAAEKLLGVKSTPITRLGSGPRISIRPFMTHKEEIRHIASEIRALLDSGVHASRIGVVARSVEPKKAAILQDAATELGFAIEPRLGLPLKAHRIPRALTVLVELQDRNFPRGEVIELIRAGLDNRIAGHTSADQMDRITRRFGIAGGRSQSLTAVIDVQAVRSPDLVSVARDYQQLVGRLEEITEVFKRPLGRARMAGEISKLLDLFRIDTETDLEAVMGLDAIIERLRATDSIGDRVDASFVVSAIEEAEPGSPTAVDGQAIWAGDLMRFRGRNVQHLFVISMQEERFPQRRHPDPLLSDSSRRLLGIPVIGDGEEEEDLLFELLLDSGAATLSFSFATTDGISRVFRESRYLRPRSGHVPASAESHAQVASVQPQSGSQSWLQRAGVPSPGLARKLHLAATIRTRSIFDGFLSTGFSEHLTRKLHEIAPTALDHFGECPQQFFFRTILDVRELEDPEHELQIDLRKKGTLDHRILERFYRDLPPDWISGGTTGSVPRLEPRVAKYLDEIIDTEFTRFDRENAPVNPTFRRIEKRLTRETLHEFVAADIADLSRSDYQPVHFEYRFGASEKYGVPDHPEAVVVSAGDHPIRVYGSIDRIDRKSDGTLRVVDYKSGKAARFRDLGEKMEEGRHLQLAFYALAIEQIFGVKDGRVEAMIKPIGDPRTATDKFSFRLWEKRDALRDVLELFSRSIVGGRFPALPSEENCKYCPATLSCRSKHDADDVAMAERFDDVAALMRAIES